MRCVLAGILVLSACSSHNVMDQPTPIPEIASPLEQVVSSDLTDVEKQIVEALSVPAIKLQTDIRDENGYFHLVANDWGPKEVFVPTPYDFDAKFREACEASNFVVVECIDEVGKQQMFECYNRASQEDELVVAFLASWPNWTQYEASMGHPSEYHIAIGSKKTGRRLHEAVAKAKSVTLSDPPPFDEKFAAELDEILSDLDEIPDDDGGSIEEYGHNFSGSTCISQFYSHQ